MVAPNGELIDQAQSTNKSAKPSYCRVPDGTGDWQTCEATFGAENIAFKCGNGVVDTSEECDGSELGGATCSSEKAFNDCERIAGPIDPSLVVVW